MNHNLVRSTFLLLIAASSATAKDITVPDDFPTIQQAVDAATVGDVIVVTSGTFFETVVIETPQLTLVGDDATIDAEYKGACIEILADDVRIKSMRLINGAPALRGVGARIEIVGNEFRGANDATIDVDGDDALIRKNEIIGCVGGIDYQSVLDVSSTRIEKNRIENNDGTALAARGGQIFVGKNQLTNVESAIRVEVDHPALRSEISGNAMFRSDNNAINVNATGAGALVADNEIEQMGDRGLQLVGGRIEVRDNKIALCNGDGIQLFGDEATISGNSVTSVTAEGIEYAGSDSLITGNVVTRTGEDGMLLAGSDNVIADNVVKRCFGDGIDLFFGQGCQIVGNVTSRNGHEGIDNSGQGTIIDGNVAKKNGRGVGPDIAGSGDGGTGTVASFAGNTFDIGGAATPQRLDARDGDLD